MAQQVINLGTGPNTATGDPIRQAFTKVNQNFTELYSGGGGTGSVTSVGITSASLTVTGSPVTGSGTINLEVPPLSVPNSKLANMAPLTVKANPTNVSGQPQDFAATSPNTVLQVNAGGTGLQWGPFGTGVQVRGATWSGGTSAIQLSNAQDVSVLNPIDMQVTRVTITTQGGPGSCTLDVWSSPVGVYPPTGANSIFTVLPAIASGIVYDDTALTGLNTTHIPAGNALTFHVAATGTFTEIVLNIALTPTQTVTSTGYTDGQAVAAVKAAMSNSGNVVTSGAAGVITQNTTGATGAWSQNLVAAKGHQTFPSGFILQWGSFALPVGSTTAVAFDVVFPHAVFSCVCTQGFSINFGYPFAVTALTTSGFVAAPDCAGGINSGTGYYMAAGW